MPLNGSEAFPAKTTAVLLDGRRAPRRPAQEDLRDRKVTREPDLCIAMSAGMMSVAAMVEELPNSMRDERHLGCPRSFWRRSRSFLQAVVMLLKVVDT